MDKCSLKSNDGKKFIIHVLLAIDISEGSHRYTYEEMHFKRNHYACAFERGESLLQRESNDFTSVDVRVRGLIGIIDSSKFLLQEKKEILNWKNLELNEKIKRILMNYLIRVYH